jgi:phosphate transport system permease protein
VSTRGVLNVAGAAVASLCIATLLFGLIAPFSGLIGFVVVAYLGFLVIYATLVWLDDDLLAVRDRVATVFFASAMLILALAIVGVVGYTVLRGIHAVLHLNFYTQDLRRAGSLQGLKVGGMTHAMVGTAWMITIAMVLTVPLGLTAAVYLNEVGGRLARFVRTIVEAMVGLPSIVAGLFIFATCVLTFKQHSGLFAALALSVDMLPIIIRAADVVLRLVPANLREASAALGAPSWRTVRDVVLPTARSGLATAVILGMARALGETAPVLLTAGYTTYLNKNPLHGNMTSLPLAAFELVRTGEKYQIERGFGAATLLLALVIALFTLARVIGGRGPGQLSTRQARRARRASVRDANRIITRMGGAPDQQATAVSP